MKKFIKESLDYCKVKKVDYAECRIVETKTENILLHNGELKNIISDLSLGFSARIFKNGAFGFASTPEINSKKILNTINLAYNFAVSSAVYNKSKINLLTEPVHISDWFSEFKIDPFKISLSEKINLLYQIDELLKDNKYINERDIEIEFIKTKKYFGNTEGSVIYQEQLYSGGHYSVKAVANEEIQVRSYPCANGSFLMQSGFEVLGELKLKENAARVKDEAIQLISAKKCPSGNSDIIISGDQLALQIHESCGHAVELDRVLGYEISYAGSSFLSTEKLNNFRYGSKNVNIVASSKTKKGLSTFGFDDEGVEAQEWYIIKDGIFKGYLTNRETGILIGEKKSRGCSRAEGFSNMPIVRMVNINLLPGDLEMPDLIGGIKKGFILDNNKSWSIDTKRENFQFGCEIAKEIKNGKLTGKIYKNPVYTGITKDFWGSCDGIANKKYFTLFGLTNCAKGEPVQINMMSHGAAPSRFRSVRLL